MRICTRISTSKIIEMQSSATAGTLIANAVAQGIALADLVEEVVTPAEYRARMLIQEPPLPAVPPKDILDLFNDLSPARKGQFKAELSKP